MEFLSKSAIPKDHQDLKGFRGDSAISNFSSSNSSTFYTHNLLLESAVDATSLSFTNYTLVYVLQFFERHSLFLFDVIFFSLSYIFHHF